MVDYVDKTKLFEEVVKYNEERKVNPDARMSEYIGKAILLICNGLAQRANFNGYSYKQDMVSDGIEDCVAAIKNFDPEKSNNPYGYMTQIAWWAFVQRILIEKKQQYLKHKNYQNHFMLNDLTNSEDVTVEKLQFSELSNGVISDFEKSQDKALTKTKKKSRLVVELEKKNAKPKKSITDSRDYKEPRRGVAKRDDKPQRNKRTRGKSPNA